jgi:hypothetical protein
MALYFCAVKAADSSECGISSGAIKDWDEHRERKSGKRLVDPPLRTVAALYRFVATIQNHNNPELKLKGIASDEGAVEHIDRVKIGQFL